MRSCNGLLRQLIVSSNWSNSSNCRSRYVNANNFGTNVNANISSRGFDSYELYNIFFNIFIYNIGGIKLALLTHKQADKPSLYGRIRYGGLIGLVVYCESPKGGIAY